VNVAGSVLIDGRNRLSRNAAAVAAGRSRLAWRSAVSSATWRTFSFLLTPTITPVRARAFAPRSPMRHCEPAATQGAAPGPTHGRASVRGLSPQPFGYQLRVPVAKISLEITPELPYLVGEHSTNLSCKNNENSHPDSCFSL
jgi:hypothetical protein